MTIDLRSLRPLLAAAVLFAAPAASQINAYHDVNGATHQLNFDTLAPQGYRMLALSIYGNTFDPRYAAVWIRRTGPHFVGFHGLPAAAWQAFYDTWSPQGYRPTILTATGSGVEPRFAGVMEYLGTPGWTSHGLTEALYSTQRTAALQAGLDVTAVDVYGTAADPRYIVSFGPVGGQTAVRSSTSALWQEHFDALVEGHARPVLAGFNDHDRFVSLWRSDDVGWWTAHHGMTSAEYDTYFDTYLPRGLYPISVQASDVNGTIRFAAVWVSRDIPPTPPFTATGQSVPALAAFDAWAENWMQATETRAASLAIVKDARLVYARGYTRALPGYPLTQPTSVFAIASNSKPLTSICVHQHYQESWTGMTPARPMLDFFPSLSPQDNRVGSITLDALLTHQGGWDRNVSSDPMIGIDATIATALSLALPIPKSAILQYMVETQNLDFTPFNNSVYSNFGFSVLGQVLETRYRSQSYAQIMQQRIFTPLGVTRAVIGGSRFAELHPGEVFYHPYRPWLARTVMTATQPWVAGQYGAWNEPNMDAHGAWVMAAPDYAKVLGAFHLGAQNPLLGQTQTTAMWTVPPGLGTTMRGWFRETVDDGRGGDVDLYHHNGRLSGCVSFIAHRVDGLSFVFFTNGDRNNLGGNTHGEQLSDIANTIPIWPNHDLFPSVGLPSFLTHTTGVMNTFGAGCAGSSGIPRMVGQGIPEVGQPMSFRISNGPAAQPALVMLGVGQIQLPLNNIGMTGCTLYQNPILMLAGATNGQGAATVPWLIPDDASLVGVVVLGQAVLLDPPANPAGLILTNGVDVHLGGWR